MQERNALKKQLKNLRQPVCRDMNELFNRGDHIRTTKRNHYDRCLAVRKFSVGRTANKQAHGPGANLDSSHHHGGTEGN
jgi:hypothetical protein